MDLVGAWLRQLLRAGTAVAIVPVALLAALLVVVLGSGGLGGLGSLGQLVAGPAVPEMDVAGRAMEHVRPPPVAPGGGAAAPRRATAPPSRGGGRAPVPALGTPGGSQQGAVRQIRPARPGSSVVIGSARPEAPAPPVAVVAPPGSASAPTGPSRPPQLTEVLGTTVNNVVLGVQSLVSKLLQALGLAPPPGR